MAEAKSVILNRCTPPRLQTFLLKGEILNLGRLGFFLND